MKNAGSAAAKLNVCSTTCRHWTAQSKGWMQLEYNLPIIPDLLFILLPSYYPSSNILWPICCQGPILPPEVCLPLYTFLPPQVTPLHLACREGHLQVVDTLLKNGANIASVDQNGFNALDMAIENGHEWVEVSCSPCCIISPLAVFEFLHSYRCMYHPVLQDCAHKYINYMYYEMTIIRYCTNFQCRQVAMLIIKSPKWRQALRNVTPSSFVEGETTPLRKLIRKMPGRFGAR